MKPSILAASLVAAAALASAAQSQRPVSLVVTGGTVITEDARGTVLVPGAIAVEGTAIVAVDIPRRSRRDIERPRRSMPAATSCCPA